MKRLVFTVQPRTVFLAGILALTSGAAVSPAQPPDQHRATSTPYTGDLSRFDSPGRDQRLQIDRVMDILHIGPGKNVADIGAGSGWFTVRAAQRVTPGGTVFAEDINPAAVQYVQERAARARLENVQPVQGRPDNPNLPDDSVNAVMMLKIYHEIARPIELMEHLRRSLRPGALVGVIDRNGNGSGTDHGVPEEIVVREMAAADFREVGRHDFVKGDGEDYFLVFAAR